MDFRLLPLAAITVTSPVFAQQNIITPTIPVDGQPVLDFRIENCTGEIGFGMLLHSGLHRPHLTDICFLSDSGTVVSGELASNLTATVDGPNGRTYEDLSMGWNEEDRNAIYFYTDDETNHCSGDASEEIYYSVRNATGYEGFTELGANRAHTSGYSITETTNTPSVSSGEVVFYLNDILLTDTDENAWGANGGVIASATFEGQSGTLEVLHGAANLFGAADGIFDLEIDGDGEISITGAFSAQNARVAGQQPSDMASVQADIIHFRGHLLGRDGALMRGYGVASGTITAVNGVERPFRSSISMLSCLSDGSG